MVKAANLRGPRGAIEDGLRKEQRRMGGKQGFSPRVKRRSSSRAARTLSVPCRAGKPREWVWRCAPVRQRHPARREDCRKRRKRGPRQESSSLVQSVVPQRYACPACGRDTIQSARVLYQGGTVLSHTMGRTTGTAVGADGGFAFGSADTVSVSTQQTHLARRCSPPERPEDWQRVRRSNSSPR